MKKIITIIGLFFLFSIAYIPSCASEGYIEKVLELRVGPEAFRMNMERLDSIQFVTQSTQKVFSSYKSAVEILGEELLRQYDIGNIDYYTMNDIIQNYHLLIYHSNKLFYYISLKDKSPSLDDLIPDIMRNYSLTRTYYNRIKYLVNKR